MISEFYKNTVDIVKIKNDILIEYASKMPEDINTTDELDNLIWRKYYNLNMLLMELIREDVFEYNHLVDLIIMFHIVYTELKNLMDEERFDNYMYELDIRIGMYFDLAYENEMYETMENIKRFNDLYLNVDNFSIAELDSSRTI